MINAYDIAYAVGMVLLAPLWLAIPGPRRKVLKALRQRMGHISVRVGNSPSVMIHAVSLGEMNATRAMVRMLAEARPQLQFIVSVTTDTGYARGIELYGTDPRVTLIRYPLDFTPAVSRVLDGLRPSVVVLMELEVWPNFVYQCARRRIPVVLVNGRLTAGSFRNYLLGGWLVRRMFRRLAGVCAQEQEYAERFLKLGAPPERVAVTGTMKFDTAQVADATLGTDELAQAVGLQPGREPIWVCGSTGPGEEEIILKAYRRLLSRHPRLRLVLVPRKPERFDEVADVIRGDAFELVRRSQSQASNLRTQTQSEISDLISQIPVILGDTMGELRKFYSLADVVLVGRTLLDLGSRQHGSDMIEPAALGKPTIVGHFTGNFAEVMNQFRTADAMRQIPDPQHLEAEVDKLLTEPEEASRMGQRAREVVRAGQGATSRHVQVILDQLEIALNRNPPRQ